MIAPPTASSTAIASSRWPATPSAATKHTTREYTLSARSRSRCRSFRPTFYCVGLNYAEHIREAAAKQGIKANLPKQPDVGYRAVNALIAHEEPVVIPRDARRCSTKASSPSSSARRAKHLSEAEALSCVLGYTIGNDVSERVWQKSDRTLWRAKNTDTFKPMGPWIETEVDLDALETRVRVNGRETTRFRTNAMLFGVATYISHDHPLCHPPPRRHHLDGHRRHLARPQAPATWSRSKSQGIGLLRNPFVAAGATG